MLYRYVATAYSNCFLSSLQVSLFSQNKGYFEKKDCVSAQVLFNTIDSGEGKL